MTTDLIGPNRERLHALLKEYNEYPERQQATGDQIQQEFGRTVGIIVIDSCGFSRTVRQHGIVNFLARLERLGRVVRPVIEAHRGRILKVEADNIFAIFDSADDAVACAAEVQRHVEIANEPLPASCEIYIAIGVGYGHVLLLGEGDAFGDEMNLACKLGEDLADRGDILVTAAAHDALADSSAWQFEKFAMSISGLDLPAFKLQR